MPNKKVVVPFPTKVEEPKSSDRLIIERALEALAPPYPNEREDAPANEVHAFSRIRTARDILKEALR